MRFSSIFALGALLVPALAVPLLDNNNVLNNIEVENILSSVKEINSDNMKRTVIEHPEQAVETCQGPLISIKPHPPIINQTAHEVPAGTKCTDEQIATI